MLCVYYTLLYGGVCLRVHAQHEVAACKVAPDIRVTAFLLTQLLILLNTHTHTWRGEMARTDMTRRLGC